MRVSAAPMDARRHGRPGWAVTTLLGLGLGAISGCGAGRFVPPAPDPGPALATTTPADRPEVGLASWYGQFHHGRPTASGEIFDMAQLTAAHRTLPFGTRLRVTNLQNGRFVGVRVNDRGPYVAGRILDLSRGAARMLDMVERGVVSVRLDVVEP